MEYSDVYAWSRQHDRVLHKVKVINVLCGCRYANAHGCACRYGYSRGRYFVKVNGEVLAEWGLYDLAAVDLAYQRVSAVSDFLWLSIAGGFLLGVAGYRGAGSS